MIYNDLEVDFPCDGAPNATTQQLAAGPLAPYIGTASPNVPKRIDIGQWEVMIDRLPRLEWRPIPSGRLMEATWSWDQYGARGAGRYTLRAPRIPVGGETWQLRDIVLARRRPVRMERRESVYGPRWQRVFLPAAGCGGILEWVFERQFQFWPTAGDTASVLRYDEARKKTTLSGMGRQWYARVPDIPQDAPRWDVWGGYRSMRAWTHARLACVPCEDA